MTRSTSQRRDPLARASRAKGADPTVRPGSAMRTARTAVRTAVRTAGRMAGRLGGAVVLVAVLVGLPYVLLAWRHDPLPATFEPQRWWELARAGYIDPKVLPNAIAVGLWLVWLQFVLATGAELLHAARHAGPTASPASNHGRAVAGSMAGSRAGRAWVLPPVQQLCGYLLAGTTMALSASPAVSSAIGSSAGSAAVAAPSLSLLSPTSTSAPTGPITGPITGTAAIIGASSQGGQARSASMGTVAGNVRQIYVCGPYDTLRSVAGRYYGDDEQWRLVRDASIGVAQPDGTRLASGFIAVSEGTRLRIPTDRGEEPGPASAPTTDPTTTRTTTRATIVPVLSPTSTRHPGTADTATSTETVANLDTVGSVETVAKVEAVADITSPASMRMPQSDEADETEGAVLVPTAAHHTVRPGETLWEIAERQYPTAHPAQMPSLVQALTRTNRGVADGHGHHLHQADVINPGMRLALPTIDTRSGPDHLTTATPSPDHPRHSDQTHQDGSAATPSSPSPSARTPSSTRPTESPTESPAGSPAGSPGGSPGAIVPAAPATTGVPEPVGTPAQQAPAAQPPLTHATRSRSHPGSIPPWMLGAVFLATGFIGLWSFRRRRRDRQVGIGQSIPSADPNLLPTHTALRVIAAPERITRISLVLRWLATTIPTVPITDTVSTSGFETDASQPQLAADAGSHGLPGPHVQALIHHRDGRIDIHLREAATLPTPWQAGNGGDAWQLPAGETLPLTQNASGMPHPNPALVQLGTTSEGAEVYLDLEAIGVLAIRDTTTPTLDTTPEGGTGLSLVTLRGIARALTATLATSPLAVLPHLHTSGFDPWLDGDVERLEAHTDLDELITEVSGHLTQIQQRLQDALTGSTLTLRAAQPEESLDPLIVIATDRTRTREHGERLTQLAGTGYRGLGVVLPADTIPTARWTLTHSPDSPHSPASETTEPTTDPATAQADVAESEAAETDAGGLGTAASETVAGVGRWLLEPLGLWLQPTSLADDELADLAALLDEASVPAVPTTPDQFPNPLADQIADQADDSGTSTLTRQAPDDPADHSVGADHHAGHPTDHPAGEAPSEPTGMPADDPSDHNPADDQETSRALPHDEDGSEEENGGQHQLRLIYTAEPGGAEPDGEQGDESSGEQGDEPSTAGELSPMREASSPESPAAPGPLPHARHRAPRSRPGESRGLVPESGSGSGSGAGSGGGFVAADWQVMVHLLGPARVTGQDLVPVRDRDGKEPRGKVVEALAWLALHREGTRDGLRTALWPEAKTEDDPEKKPSASVANTLSRARLVLGQIVGPQARTWVPHSQAVLRLDPAVTTDIQQLQAHLAYASTHQHHPDLAIPVLSDGLSLVRGEPVRWTWLEAETGSLLTTVPTTAASLLAELSLQAGDLDGALIATDIGLRIMPTHRDLFGLRMRIRAAAGDFSAVRAEYEAYVRAEAAQAFPDEEIDDELEQLYITLIRSRHQS